ncbi:RNA-dependent RNA polymerase [Erysiphe necator associated tombus-like virus 8]|nr:RNA-dependent RNA polymerase [Erysiphe necator associated tombus-like virus 8]
MPRLPARPLESFPLRYRDARKRKIYTNAVESLCALPLSIADAFVKGFVKDEKLNLLLKLDPVPRAILPLSARLNVIEGSINAHREHAMFEAIDEVFGRLTVMKGYNAGERGRIIAEKWHRFADPVALGMDASRFDQHVSMLALLFENACFLDHCTNDEERRVLSKVLSWTTSSRGKMVATDGSVKFAREAGRLSGCMHTSSGNILLMCSMFWTFMQQFGVKWDYINDGDDCVLFLERKDVARVSREVDAWFTDMGFTMVVEPPAYELEHVDFCQSRPVWTPSGYIMCRNPHTALVKDTVCLKRIDCEANWRSWTRSVGECGMSLAGGIPMFQAFYGAYLRSAGDAKINKMHKAEGGLKLASAGMHRKEQEIDDFTRLSFYAAWGILPDAQVVAEKEYSAMLLDYHDPEPLAEPLCLPSLF